MLWDKPLLRSVTEKRFPEPFKLWTFPCGDRSWSWWLITALQFIHEAIQMIKGTHQGLNSCLNRKINALFSGLLNGQQNLACWDIFLPCFPSIFFCSVCTAHHKAPKATLKPIWIHSIATILRKPCSEWLSLSPPRFKANQKRSCHLCMEVAKKKESRIVPQAWQPWSPAPIAFHEKV